MAIAGTTFICVVVIAVHYATRGGLGPREYILVYRQLKGDADDTGRALDALLSWRKLHGATDLGHDEGFEYTYRVRLGSSVKPEAVLSRLQSVAGLSQPSLISPESQLAI